jgi:hypothetical protein
LLWLDLLRFRQTQIPIFTLHQTTQHRHSGAGRNPVTTLQKTPICPNETMCYWIPACAGMTAVCVLGAVAMAPLAALSQYSGQQWAKAEMTAAKQHGTRFA